MNIYLAPLEGLTDPIFRNAVQKYFGGIDKYYTPFIVTQESGKYRPRDQKGVAPENNEGILLVPQILTKYADQFNRTATDMARLGYSEVNLNLGCPSGTVASKGRGSGFLLHLEELNRFLEEIFNYAEQVEVASDMGGGTGHLEISVKTRIGVYSPDEFEEILEIYNQYPIKELTIHPRVRKEFYNGTPHKDVFFEALKNSKNPVVYNGDLNTPTQINAFTKEVEEIAPIWTDSVMLGRGMIRNPALARMTKDSEYRLTKEILRQFHEEVYTKHRQELSGDTYVLQHMKEHWFYMIQLFEDSDKQAKQIRKCKNCYEYESILNGLFSEGSLKNE